MLNNYTILGTTTLQEDARYTLCVRVWYNYEGQLQNPCCKGQLCKPTDSGELTSTPIFEIGDVILEYSYFYYHFGAG
ncbi:MAG: hypothetical protein C0595_10630 [Marinilabiliales bacterium]|nr:MAG: hypothetical protein C0595_10630 [Marinilabiliales bacterium]